LQHRADADHLSAALHCLVRRVAGIQVGEDEDGSLAGYRTAGPFGLADRGDGGSVVLHRAVDGQAWFALPYDLRGLGDLVDVCSRGGGSGAEADHCHSRLDAERPGGRGALNGDVG
jgi:hypothetical protein